MAPQSKQLQKCVCYCIISIIVTEQKRRKTLRRKSYVGYISFVLVWAPHSPKCIKVSAIQTWKMDEDNGAFLTSFFLINCQSNYSMNDTNIIWCSIPYQKSHRCSFSRWLSLRPVLPSYYHHHHLDMKGEKQVLHHCQGETLISEHLHSPPSSTGCMNTLPRRSLIGRWWKSWHSANAQSRQALPHPPPCTVTLSWWH